MLDDNGYPQEFDQKKENVFLREITIQSMVRGGASKTQIVDAITKLYRIDKEDFTEDEIEKKVEKWIRTEEIVSETNEGRSIRTEVEKWVEGQKSNIRNKAQHGRNKFLLRDCYNDLTLKNAKEKSICRMAFSRLCESGVIEKDPHTAGAYRTVSNGPEKLDFINADTTQYPIRFPLGVHELVETYQKSLIVIAGEPNSGKTGYCMNLAWKNRDLRPKYFSCEGGAAELKIRLQKFNYPLEQWSVIDFMGKSDDYTKDIDPDGLNIIDYLEVSKDFYEIGGMLTDIYDCLRKGVAVVAIQKPTGRNTGVGGERTLDKARLYMAIEPGIIRIIKAKLWRQECVNPNGLFVKWTLSGGATFKVMPDPVTGDNWRRL
jgi:hypothetical protein